MTVSLPVVFSDRTQNRLHELQGYIAFYNIRAAERVITRILNAAEMLGDHPNHCPVWNSGPTRALAVPGLPYRIHYRVAAERVEVITVAHTSQLPPVGVQM